MIVRLDEIALVVLQKFIWTFIFSLLKLILQRAQLLSQTANLFVLLFELLL